MKSAIRIALKVLYLVKKDSVYIHIHIYLPFNFRRILLEILPDKRKRKWRKRKAGTQQKNAFPPVLINWDFKKLFIKGFMVLTQFH